MEINPAFIRLLESLKTATLEGRLRWQETVSEDAFRVVIGQGMVRVGFRRFSQIEALWKQAVSVAGPTPPAGIKQYDEANQGEYYAVLVDQRGNERDFVQDVPGNPTLLKDLFYLARRTEKSTEELIEQMIGVVEAGKA